MKDFQAIDFSVFKNFKRPFRIGLTGGIGSGKSTISTVFKTLGISVYNSDDAAKWLMENDTDLTTLLKQHFGENVFDAAGSLQRVLLASKVFGNAEQLALLNSLVHPAVITHHKNWYTKRSTEPYIVKEAAILFESGTYKDCDFVITVTAPEEIRINRVMKRDSIDRETALKRMKSQWNEEEKIHRSDWVINNDNSSLLLPDILSFHEKLSITAQ